MFVVIRLHKYLPIALQRDLQFDLQKSVFKLGITRLHEHLHKQVQVKIRIQLLNYGSLTGGGKNMKIKSLKEKRGQVGIGTMIVFIAMVLVAAVAAAVLTQTSGYLQQRAMSVGRETTEEVSTGIQISGVEGRTNGTTSDSSISQIAVFIRTNTGGTSIDLGQTLLKLNDGTNQAVFVHNSTTNSTNVVDTGVSQKFNSSEVKAWNGASDSTFGLLILQDYDDSLNGTNPTLNRGDRAALLINTTKTFGGLGSRSEITGSVVPEIGTEGVIKFNTPTAFTEKRIYQLQ